MWGMMSKTTRWNETRAVCTRVVSETGVWSDNTICLFLKRMYCLSGNKYEWSLFLFKKFGYFCYFNAICMDWKALSGLSHLLGWLFWILPARLQMSISKSINTQDHSIKNKQKTQIYRLHFRQDSQSLHWLWRAGKRRYHFYLICRPTSL